MIFDKLSHFNSYLSVHPYFKNVLFFFKNKDLIQMAPGKYEVDDNGVIALISEYKTKEKSETFIECHKKYIDIQIVLTGNEKIGICNKQDCKEWEYDENKDFQKLEGELDLISLKPDAFIVLFPQDGHMPQLKYKDVPEFIKKVVFKVPVLK